MEALTDAYLSWRSKGSPPVVVDEHLWSIMTIDFFGMSFLSVWAHNLPSLQERCPMSFTHMENAQTANETIVRSGYLGCSPDTVTVAISLRVLEAYRQLHRVCPRLSAQAFVKALCHLHEV